ncbi:MAG: hypothetical protein J1F23_05040 [Oscillospiraceae bacterium]|nr:hypothetical protein [Oscillospiraceae bacterium]
MKHIYKRLTALLTVFALMVAAVSVTANAVDVGRSCTLTVNLSGKSEYADIEEADLVADFYKVADAVADSSYDSYAYSDPYPAYSGLVLNGIQDNSGWTDLAQKAADRALANDSPAISGVSIETPVKNLSTGLYLVLVHGAGVENYVSEGKDKDGNKIISTIASTSSHTYRFAPILLSLPGREGISGDWIYDTAITLKAEQQTRLGSLQIVKNLIGFVSGSPATFVFDIEAVFDGKIVYSDVVSITFNQAGTNKVTVDNIPVGAQVTVTEVYEGVCYRLISEKNQTTMITADEIVSVEFTNAPNDKINSGGGITNHFEYTSDGWTWTPNPHNS